MKKKKLICSICLLMSIALLWLLKGNISVSAAGHTTHTYGAWSTYTKANCTKCEVQKRTCTYTYPGGAKCGASEKRNVGSPLGHIWGSWRTSKKATCTSGGVEKRSCTRSGCSASESRNTSALGHSYGSYTVTSKATCTTSGKKTATCSRSYCYATKTMTIPATGHSCTGVIKREDATCTKDGWEGVQCNKCGEVPSKNVIKATGHSFTGVIKRKAATCTEEGWEGVQCNNCGEVPVKNIIEKIDHDWVDQYYMTKPTCTENGAMLQKCSRCDEKRVKTVKAPGHSYTGVVKMESPTCLEAGYTGILCNNCGMLGSKVVLDPLGHTFPIDESGNLKPCSRCGEKPPQRSVFNVFANTEYHFGAKGTYDEYAPNADRFSDLDKPGWGMITVSSSEDFTVSANVDYLNIYVNGTKYNKSYSGKGNANNCTYVYIQPNPRKMDEYGDRECILTIASGNNKVTTKITQSEYLVNSSYVGRKTDFAKYIDARFSKYLTSSKWQSGGSSTIDGESGADKLKRRLHGDVTTNGIEIFQCTDKNYSDVFIAVNSEFDSQDKDYINVTYSVFHVFSTDVLNATQTRLRFDVIDSYGMKINGDTFKEVISSDTGIQTEEYDISVEDPEYEALSKVVSAASWGVNKVAGALGKYYGGTIGKFVVTKVTGWIITPIGNAVLKNADSRQNKTCVEFTNGLQLTLDKGTELSNPNGAGEEQSRIDVLFICTSQIDYTISFSLFDSYGNTGSYRYSFKASATGNAKSDNNCSHTFYGSYETVVNPTCDKSGLKAAKCTKCGEILQEIEIKPLGHDLVAVDVKMATCDEPGYKQYECARENCNYCRKDSIMASHVFNGDYRTTKEPTCTEDGLKEGKCHVCNQTVSKIVLPALGHEVEDPNAKNPVCKRCGLPIEELNDKLSIWGWQDNMTYYFRWNGCSENAPVNPWNMIELDGNGKPCIRFTVTAQNDWTVAVSKVSSGASNVNLSMNGTKSQASLSGKAGTSTVYVYFDKMQLDSTTDNSATLTFECGQKTLSCKLYQSSYKSVNGLEMGVYINEVKSSDYYKYFKCAEKYTNTSGLTYNSGNSKHSHNGKSVTAEDHLFGKELTNGIEFFHCTDPAYGNVFMALNTYIESDGNVFVKYCVFRISYESVMNAAQKNIQIKVLDDNGMYLRNSNGKIAAVRGSNLEVENINVKSVDKDFEAFQETLDVSKQFISTINDFATISSIELDSLTKVIFRNGLVQKGIDKCVKPAVKFLGKMALKKVFDDSNEFTLSGIDQIELSLDSDTSLETGTGAVNLLVARCSTGFFDFSINVYDYYRGTSASMSGTFRLDESQC